jgi:hypothetical protein
MNFGIHHSNILRFKKIESDVGDNSVPVQCLAKSVRFPDQSKEIKSENKA